MLDNADVAKKLHGTWCHHNTTAEFTIRILKTKIKVSGVDTDDGERFVVSDVVWDGKVLSFNTLMPSTNWKVMRRFTVMRNNTVRHEYSRVETWKKRKAK